MQKLLDNLLEAGLAQGCYPGAVAACGCRDRVFAISWKGSLMDGGDEVNRATRYDMASLTKILGPTMLALQAIEEGHLTLWDTLGMYFNDLPEEKRGITIKALMTHTAGFEPSFRLDWECDAPEDVLKALILGYMKLGGIQMQITCISREILEDAYRNPEMHKNLIVRVGGYSEYFYRLSDSLKRMIIERTIQNEV